MQRMDQSAQPESPYAWRRLAASLALMTIGGSGMYAMSVALTPVQGEFGITRGDASLPYTLTTIGFGLGGILMGKLADRVGVMVPVVVAAVSLGCGFVLAGLSANLWQFSLAHGVLIGLLGCSATFAPLVADTSLWFNRRRGIAVAICASGNYLAGALWPPVMQFFFDAFGWRATYVGTGVFCIASMLALALVLRPRPPALESTPHARTASVHSTAPLALPPNVLMTLLVTSGIACCVAMSMPQVHIVAYCGDLGYGAARGAEMLSLMFGFGIVSRVASGWICDRIGGLRTLLLGAVLQAIALALFLPFDGLASLYVVSALFGLFQGGLVPSYAIIVREHFAPREAGMRVGIVFMATLLGMGLGGWLSGALFDLTGSYRAAFVNGIAWSLATLCIAAWLLAREASAARRGTQGLLPRGRQAD
ncbi:MAG TPA: MFS transporter [Burkholderiales bacterium]|jgi:MFS family permease